MAPGGAQEYLGVTPDLCTLGKAVGGGFPLSVFGGRREIMNHLMPEGNCQHSGTYNGHPVAVAAGLAAVSAYRESGFYDHIHSLAGRLYAGLNEILARHEVRGRVQGLGARFGVYFGVRDEVRNYRDAVKHDRALMLKFVAAAIENGVYFHDYGGAACHHGFCAAMTVRRRRSPESARSSRCVAKPAHRLAARRSRVLFRVGVAVVGIQASACAG
jgi:glutamate-1-semialdehyde 2,1-aminomutase